MNQSTNRGKQSPDRAALGQRFLRSLRGRSRLGGIAVVVLIALYSVAAPNLNERFGWNLPQIRADSQGNVRLADSKRDSNRESGGVATGSDPSDPAVERGDQYADEGDQESSRESDAEAAESVAGGESSEDLLYGLLREVSRDRYVSPAGLLYGPGSAEGHRLEHLRRHTKDDPNRPGSHGVFDGGMEGALKIIDRAYQRATSGQRSTKKIDDGRTIYTIDMGGRVGYVGGREGRNRRNPMARRIRIVLEENRLITAYPL